VADAISKAVIQWLLRRWSISIAGTEAFAYGIDGDADSPRFELIAHIRPGNEPTEVLERAREAFLLNAAEPVRLNKNGAINLGTRRPDGTSPHCLVVVILDAEQPRTPRVVIGIVTTCSTEADARRKLDKLLSNPPNP
jgi:hypothetical protein